MSFFKRATAFLLLLSLIILPAKEVFASGRTPILNRPTVTVAQMRNWAIKKGANKTFVELAQTFYDVSVSKGVDPAVTYAQSAKETNFMHYTGVVSIDFKNPCGLKITAGGGDYDKQAHKKFSSWKEGITAQVDHLALYAGQKGYPDPKSPDPRHFSSIYGVAPYVENLSARWAPSKTYGEEVVVYMNQIKAQAGGNASQPAPKPAPAPTPAPQPKPQPTQPKRNISVTRLSGPNRYATAEKINQIAKPNSDIAVIADGRLYADVMVGTNLANQVGGHLYIARAQKLNPEVMTRIKSHQIKRVYLIGDPSSFNDNIVKQLGASGARVERISARNRYFLAENVANRYNSSTAVLVNGSDFADAISIGPVAARQNLPVYMTNGSNCTSGTLKALKNKKKVILVGGTGAISSQIERELQGAGVHIQRVSGRNRYITSMEVAKFFFPSANQTIFATGHDFADVLTGVTLADRINAPILLVQGNALDSNQVAYLNSIPLQKAYALGGTTAISDALFQNIQKTLQ